MRCIRSISAKHAAWHDCINRWLPRLHDANLYRRGMRAQQHRIGFLISRCWFDKHGVELAARRVRLWHIQCFKVVEIGFNFWAFGNLESKTNEHVFQSLSCLSDDVGTAPSLSAHKFREIHGFSCNLLSAFPCEQRGHAFGDGCINYLSASVNGLTCRFTLVGVLDFAKLGPQHRKRRLFTRKLGLNRPQRSRVRCTRYGRQGPSLGLGNLASK